MTINRTRLHQLRRRAARSKRLPTVLEQWRALGALPSPLTDGRHERLLELLRAPQNTREPLEGSIQEIVSDFATPPSSAIVIDWNIDDEPALIIEARILRRITPYLRDLYPDGLVVADQPPTLSLIIDFDETTFQAELLRLVG